MENAAQDLSELNIDLRSTNTINISVCGLHGVLDVGGLCYMYG